MVEYDEYCVKSKVKPKYVKKKEKTYCLVCKKKTDNRKTIVILKNQLKTNTKQKIVFANYKTCKFIVKSVKSTQVTRFQKRLVPISKNIIKDKSKCPIS